MVGLLVVIGAVAAYVFFREATARRAAKTGRVERPGPSEEV